MYDGRDSRSVGITTYVDVDEKFKRNSMRAHKSFKRNVLFGQNSVYEVILLGFCISNSVHIQFIFSVYRSDYFYSYLSSLVKYFPDYDEP